MFRSAVVRMLFLPSLVLLALAGSRAEGELYLPFNANQSWYVCQGYLSTLTQTHEDTHALDLTLDPNGIGTAGCSSVNQSHSAHQQVLAPGKGTVIHRDYNLQTCPPNPPAPCPCANVPVLTRDLICLNLDDGGSLVIGHFTPGSRVPEGRVDVGEVLGTLAVESDRCSDDGIFNGDYSHIHIAAYESDDCSKPSTPFSGTTYGFWGVPDLPDMSGRSALEDFRNHWFGTGLSNLEVQEDWDDAGHLGTDTDCDEGHGFNEVYFGHCPQGEPIISGFRFRNLPVGSGTYLSSAAMVLTADGPYSGSLDVKISAEKSMFAAPFHSSNMPSDRLDRIHGEEIWTIEEHWDLGDIVETPELRSTLQPLVRLSSWPRDVNSVAFVTQPKAESGSSHRRVTAWERAQFQPDLLPPRLVVTQFRTLSPLDAWKGNNPPIAKAGPGQSFTGSGIRITLDGRGSSDPDQQGITYDWKQLDGPPVTLHDHQTSTPWFVTDPVAEFYVFELTVTDNGWGELQTRDTVTVTRDPAP